MLLDTYKITLNSTISGDWKQDWITNYSSSAELIKGSTVDEFRVTNSTRGLHFEAFCRRSPKQQQLQRNQGVSELFSISDLINLHS